MGVSELEAGLLSGEARFREIPESLRDAPEHGGSELHLPPLPHREIAARLDRSGAAKLPIRHQGAPENYTCRPAARCPCVYFRFYSFAAAVGGGSKTRPCAVSIAA